MRFFHHLIRHKIWSWSFIIKSLFFFPKEKNLWFKLTCTTKFCPLHMKYSCCIHHKVLIFHMNYLGKQSKAYEPFIYGPWASIFTFAENEPVSHGNSLKIWKQKRSLSLTLQQIPTMDDGPRSIKARKIEWHFFALSPFKFVSIAVTIWPN